MGLFGRSKKTKKEKKTASPAPQASAKKPVNSSLDARRPEQSRYKQPASRESSVPNLARQQQQQQPQQIPQKSMQYAPQQQTTPPPPAPVMEQPKPVQPEMAPPVENQQARESEQAGIDLTRSLVKRFIADIWNRGEIDLIPEVCSPSLRFNGNTGFDRVGHEGLARMVATIRDALDDYHCEIHSMVVENNKAFCRLRFTGKHTGNLLGYPPSGRVVGWMGATEFTCQGGKILKVWELGDIKTLEEQLIAPEEEERALHGEV